MKKNSRMAKFLNKKCLKAFGISLDTLYNAIKSSKEESSNSLINNESLKGKEKDDK